MLVISVREKVSELQAILKNLHTMFSVNGIKVTVFTAFGEFMLLISNPGLRV